MPPLHRSLALVAYAALVAVMAGCGQKPSGPPTPATNGQPGGQAASSSPTSGLNLVWSDDFDGIPGSSPNRAMWRFDKGGGGWGNKELETYVDDTEHCHIVKDPDATDGKALDITATHDADGKYRSARLSSFGTAMFQYGYIETRVKLPEGQGIWPAFWMMGADVGSSGWPKCGELNILEENGQYPSSIRASLYGPGFTGDQSLRGAYTLPNGQKFTDAYHLFGVKWSRGAVTFYVDNNPYQSFARPQAPHGTWPFDHPMFMLLNLAVGGKNVGPPSSRTSFPEQVRVDYIHVYGPEKPGPHNGPHNIPGTIQAEDFDDGGEGVGYLQFDTNNPGSTYRPADAVGIADCTDAGGGYYLGWSGPGQWYKYTVNVQSSGVHPVVFRVASGVKGGGWFHIEDENGKHLTGSMKVPSTGDWQHWVNLNGKVTLSRGTHTLKLFEETGGLNVNYMTFE